MDEASELLLKAADIIARDGHHKGEVCADRSDPHSPVCAEGAMNRALTGEAHRWPLGTAWETRWFAYEQLDSVIGKITGGSTFSVANWNDLPDTTAEDVILALKKAATDGN